MARFTYPFGGGGGDVSFTEEGCIVFPNNGEICNIANSSSDGLNLSTIQINPDTSYNDDRYIVIDPTIPNHVHIRAGGEIDKSQAVLLLGGEKNAVAVIDSFGGVGIQATQPESHDYINNESLVASSYVQTSFSEPTQIGASVVVNDTTYFVTDIIQVEEQIWHIEVGIEEAIFQPNGTYEFVFNNYPSQYWFFGNDGVLSGPNEGSLIVNGLVGTSSQNLSLYSSAGNSVVLDGDSGEFLNDPEVPSNQIATIGDVEAAVPGSQIRYSPTFTATGLTFTGSDTTYPTYNSYYVKTGKMVSFVVEVDCTTVTNFGTGQYKVQLPFTPAVGFNHFTGWVLVDPAVNPDVSTGHVILNADTAGITDILDLHYLKQAGGAHTPIVEGLFLQGIPVTLTTSSKIYINGTYICQ